MIELIVLNHLSSALDVPVGMEYPSTPTGCFVVLEKTGSARENFLSRATFAIKSHGDTLLEAAQLNEQVKAAMDELDELPAICRSALNTDYNFTDTAQRRYRYQAVYDITHY